MLEGIYYETKPEKQRTIGNVARLSCGLLIMDEIRLAQEMQQKLDARSGLQVIQNKLGGIWE